MWDKNVYFCVLTDQFHQILSFKERRFCICVGGKCKSGEKGGGVQCAVCTIKGPGLKSLILNLRINFYSLNVY